jgi:hypothetical protein
MQLAPYCLSFASITAEARLSMSQLECHLCHLFGRRVVLAAIVNRARWHRGDEIHPPWSVLRSTYIGAEVELDFDDSLFGKPAS